MTDEELAEIRSRVDTSLTLAPGVAPALRRIGEMGNDILRLLAEVAQLRDLARALADGKADFREDDWPGAWVCSLCLEESKTSSIEDRAISHTADCIVTKARVLLGEEKRHDV